jgi:hypothetical protein
MSAILQDPIYSAPAIIPLYENKPGHYCNLGNDWNHWTLTGFPFIPFVSLVNSVKVVIIIH